MDTAALTETSLSLKAHATRHMNAAHRNGTLLVCGTKEGTVEICRTSERGIYTVDGKRMRRADAIKHMMTLYIVED